MATAKQVQHYQAMAEEAARFFGRDPGLPVTANRAALMIASHRRMQARIDAMPAPAPRPAYKPTFCYDFDDEFTHVVLEDFLRYHAADEALCAWARTAGLGERYRGVQRVL